MTPALRARVRFVLIAIILATLPCYCTGYLMVRLARSLEEQAKPGSMLSPGKMLALGERHSEMEIDQGKDRVCLYGRPQSARIENISNWTIITLCPLNSLNIEKIWSF